MITMASLLFAQPFVQVQIKDNIKAPRHWPFVRAIHRSPVNSPHKRPVTRKMLSFDDVVMLFIKKRHKKALMGVKSITHAASMK